MKNYHPVEVMGVRVEMPSNQPIVLLKELDGVVGEEEIYAKYVNSNYTEKRPYRTYRLDKISTLREIFLKPISETSKPSPEVKIEDAIVKDTPLETYTMYQDNK